MKVERCPVCDWEIKDGGVIATVGDKKIVVCCDECAEKTKESPARHAGAAE